MHVHLSKLHKKINKYLALRTTEMKIRLKKWNETKKDQRAKWKYPINLSCLSEVMIQTDITSTDTVNLYS